MKPELQNILAKQPNVPVGFLYQAKRNINQQKTCFEQNYQVKLQDPQVRDMSADQKKTTLLKAKKPSNVTRIISVGITVAIIFTNIVIFNYSTVHYSTDRQKFDIPESSSVSDNKRTDNQWKRDVNPGCYKLTVNAIPSFRQPNKDNEY